ncbi:hypothetical protein F5Y18DRAFT_417082 [Xylariaceae sp. FL1019]|nr:hypothetical protein F5Y18DRAFT_417082 [Xylariaceae sp. FL1019]
MGEPNDSKSHELERGGSVRTSMRRSLHQAEENDDYDLQAMGISDGFRPAHVAQNHPSHVTHNSISSWEPPAPRPVSPRPSSIAKPHPPRESFSLRNDGVARGLARSSSTSTQSPFVDSETPYNGPSGPSHPYQMYPQNVRLARTASIATTSTAPITERSYNGPRGPTHPYNIYPQNVTSGDPAEPSEPGLSESAGRDNIVGFLGTTDHYRRRIGPDGEEAADLIGPDGHTEQLPPYTRYPDEVSAQKARDMAAIPAGASLDIVQPTPTTTSTPTQPNLEIPGAGGIGLATRNPEFASTEDLGRLGSPASRRSVRSFTSDASHHAINTGALAVVGEKRTQKNWKIAAKRKVWGIVPCWCVVLGMVVLVFLGILVGVLIGTVFSHGPPKKHPSDPAYSQDSSTTTTDAVPYPTLPPGLPSLPEKTYSVGLGQASRSSSACFADENLEASWDCNPTFSELTMQTRKLDDAPETAAYVIDFSHNKSLTLDANFYAYGVQPPDFSVTNITLNLVNDTFQLTQGPAWAFAVPYTKTILVPEPYLQAPGSTSVEEDKHYAHQARGRHLRPRMQYGQDFKRRGVAQPGDKPWICTWPETILEMFIYILDESSHGGDQYDQDDHSPPNSSQGYPSSTAANAAQSSQPSRRSDGGSNDDDDDSLPYDDGGHDYQSSNSSPMTSPMTSPPTSPTVSTSTSSPASSSTNWFGPIPSIPQGPPLYPKVFKVDERRNAKPSSSDLPTCRQVVIGSDGEPAQPYVVNGEQVTIRIEFNGNYAKNSEDAKKRMSKRDSPYGNEVSDCGCLWWPNQ